MAGFENELREIEGLAGRQSGLGGTMERLGMEQYGSGKTLGKGMISSAAGIAAREPSWYADRAAVTSNQAFDESQGVLNRTLGRMGINPNSGRFVGLNTQWGLARAAAEAGARNRAAQDSERDAFNRQITVANQAQEDANAGLGLLRSAGGLYGQAAGDRAGLAGQYDKLETERAKYSGIKRAQNRNASQSRIDALLKRISNLGSKGPLMIGAPERTLGYTGRG